MEGPSYTCSIVNLFEVNPNSYSGALAIQPSLSRIVSEKADGRK